jgi:hypothetical protein
VRFVATKFGNVVRGGVQNRLRFRSRGDQDERRHPTRRARGPQPRGPRSRVSERVQPVTAIYVGKLGPTATAKIAVLQNPLDRGGPSRGGVIRDGAPRRRSQAQPSCGSNTPRSAPEETLGG